MLLRSHRVRRVNRTPLRNKRASWPSLNHRPAPSPSPGSTRYFTQSRARLFQEPASRSNSELSEVSWPASTHERSYSSRPPLTSSPSSSPLPPALVCQPNPNRFGLPRGCILGKLIDRDDEDEEPDDDRNGIQPQRLLFLFVGGGHGNRARKWSPISFCRPGAI